MKLFGPSLRKKLTSPIGSATIKAYNEVPGPRPLPLIGNIWRYLPMIGQYNMEDAPKNGQINLKQFGPLVREVIYGSLSVLHVFDPNDMETIFRNEGKYPFRRSHRALLKYRRDRPEIYASGGLFPENGKEWYRLRKLVQGIMLNPANVNMYIPHIDIISDNLIDHIIKSKSSCNEMSDFMSDLYRWALEAIGYILLDRRLGCLDDERQDEAEELIDAAHATHDAIMRTELGTLDLWEHWPTSNYRKLSVAQDTMATIIDKYVKIKQLDLLPSSSSSTLSESSSEPTPNETVECESILGQLLCCPDADYKDVFTLTMDMFLAGIDTTAFVAGFTLYHLACHPDIQEKVRSEIIEHLPSKTSHVTAEGITSMKYLKACVKESLRLNPLSIGTGRVTTKDLVIRGYHVPKGTMIITQNQVACIQEANFPEAYSFAPERWLSSSTASTTSTSSPSSLSSSSDQIWQRSSSFASLPFGYGTRMCVGRRLSEMEVYTLLAKILRNFKIEYHYQPIGMKTRLVNVPDKPLKLRFIELST